MARPLYPDRALPGEETRIGRKTRRRGIIRFAKDAQRAYNYGRSTQTEITALQPKSPFIGTEDNFKEYQAFWNLANVKAFPVSALQARPEKQRRAAAARAAAGVVAGRERDRACWPPKT